MTARELILAHQGGWDEMLMVLVPVALFVGLLWLANRRAEQQQLQEQEPAAQSQAPPEAAPEQAPPGRPEGADPGGEGADGAP